MTRAIIAGHTGQDGTYLYRHLLKKNYELVGISRKSVLSSEQKDIPLINISNSSEVDRLIKDFQPHELYYLAAVHQSSSDSEVVESELFKESININVVVPIHFLEAIKNFSAKTRLFYAGSSHVFGNTTEQIQDEHTPFQPNCIYGITKTAGIHACRYYRQTHSVFASAGIFYNHESPLRPGKFVSQKIVDTAIAIKSGNANELVLGSLNIQIDWGFAGDYVDAAFRILQLESPDDFIISSGERHTVKDFVEHVFDYLKMDWRLYVKENPALITKTPKKNLYGNHKKLTALTGWNPSINFSELVKLMVNAKLEKYELT